MTNAMSLGFGLFLVLLLRGLSLGHAQQDARRPNLLFIMSDQQRFDAMSAAGNSELKTPNMDRIAKEGVMFRNCYSGNPICVPSRAIILTGCSSENLNVFGNGGMKSQNVPNLPTFDSVLADNGYAAEYYGKWHTPNQFGEAYDNDVTKGSSTSSGKAFREWLLTKGVGPKEPGHGELFNKGSERPYEPVQLDANYDFAFEGTPEEKMKLKSAQGSRFGKHDLPPNVSNAAFTAEQTLEALDRLKDGEQPFTLTCSFNPPHPPIIVQEPYFSMFPASDIAVPVSINDTMIDSPYSARASQPSELPYKDPKNIRDMRQIYYGKVREVDDWIGKILDKLDDLGLAENTFVIFTADHGEMLGDHGLHSKMIFYEGSAHVPLLMRFPGRIEPGTVVEEPVSGMDLFSTILDYMDLPIPESNGVSLRTFIEGNPVPHDVVSSSKQTAKKVPNYMIRSGDLKLLVSYRSPTDMSPDALYDLAEDPLEMTNRILQNPKKVEMMMDAFRDWINKNHLLDEAPPVPSQCSVLID